MEMLCIGDEHLLLACMRRDAKLGRTLVDSDGEYVPADYAVVGLKSDPQRLLAIDDEPSHFLHRHEGHVTLYDSEGGDDPIEIGRYRAY